MELYSLICFQQVKTQLKYFIFEIGIYLFISKFIVAKSSASPYPISNSRNKFVQELNENEHKLFNRSFDTATNFLTKSGKLKQTKLCLNKSWTTKKPEHYNNDNHIDTFEGMSREIPAPPPTTTKHFFQLPTKSNVPLTKMQNLNRNVAEVLPCAAHARQRQDASDFKAKIKVSNGATNPLSKNGRNSLAITGRVDFCLKMHRKHSEVNAIWDVYGMKKYLFSISKTYFHLVRVLATTRHVLQCPVPI